MVNFSIFLDTLTRNQTAHLKSSVVTGSIVWSFNRPRESFAGAGSRQVVGSRLFMMVGGRGPFKS